MRFVPAFLLVADRTGGVTAGGVSRLGARRDARQLPPLHNESSESAERHPDRERKAMERILACPASAPDQTGVALTPFGGGMSRTHGTARAMRWTAGGLVLMAMGYATIVGAGWSRYGHLTPASPDECDSRLDQFMPEYEVAERHHVRVAAPAAITLAAAADTDFQQSRIIRAIFRAREFVLGAKPDAETRPRGLLAQTTALGWRVLAEEPGRKIVVGAVTQPWLPNVVFRGLAPEEFRLFHEPGYVKIIWALRADSVGKTESIFRTETRVMTTDPIARAKFRWYWARFFLGIVLIRRVMLGLLKADAERRALEARPTP